MKKSSKKKVKKPTKTMGTKQMMAQLNKTPKVDKNHPKTGYVHPADNRDKKAVLSK